MDFGVEGQFSAFVLDDDGRAINQAKAGSVIGIDASIVTKSIIAHVRCEAEQIAAIISD